MNITYIEKDFIANIKQDIKLFIGLQPDLTTENQFFITFGL